MVWGRRLVDGEGMEKNEGRHWNVTMGLPPLCREINRPRTRDGTGCTRSTSGHRHAPVRMDWRQVGELEVT